MSAIEITEAYPRCRRSSRHTADYSDLPLSVDEIKDHLRQEYDVAIYVDGWSKPWLCYLDVNDQLRAQCPTAPKVVPLVVQVSRGAAVYTGCDCACHGEVADEVRDHK